MINNQDRPASVSRPQGSTAPGRPRTACFYAPVRDRALLDTTEFYAQDIAILRDLGFDVRIATRFDEIPLGCDLYFVWWWSWSFLPILKARLAGRPVLITGVIDRVLYERRSAPARWVFRRNFAASDWNVVISEDEYRWVRRTFRGEHVTYIPLGVDTDRHAQGERPREDFCLTLCWMRHGNALRKSMYELVRAIPKIRTACPGLRFVLAGSPEDGGPRLQALAAELDVADIVSFPGRIPVDEKIRLMQTCRMYLQPTKFEGFGMAIAEALSCGAPVVTSAVGAVPEVIGDCATFVDGSDPDSIAEGVIGLDHDPHRRQWQSAAGRERIERGFSLRRRREGLAEIIDRLLAGAGPRRGVQPVEVINGVY